MKGGYFVYLQWTMKISFLSLAVVLGLSVTACDDAERKQKEAAEAQVAADKKIADAKMEADKKIADAKMEADKKMAEANASMKTTRDDARNAYNKKVADLQKDIIDFQVKYEKKKGKVESDKVVADLNAKIASFRSDLARLDTTTPATMDGVKKDLDTSLDAITKSLDTWKKQL